MGEVGVMRSIITTLALGKRELPFSWSLLPRNRK
jgi:hypothetical protein